MSLVDKHEFVCDKSCMKTYQILNDDGVDKAFLGDSRSWIGEIVKGNPNPALYPDAITVEKPFGLPGTYTASSKNFKEMTPADLLKGIWKDLPPAAQKELMRKSYP